VISLDPIAYFHSSFEDKADLPRQAVLSEKQKGILRFIPGKQFEQALEDLEGMEKIWVLFWMHQVSHWKAKIQPPRDVSKKGVFATRSPHRPNPIGLSCVTLLSRKGRDLIIQGHDLLDGSPILDVKPYLPYADSFPLARTGWMEEVPALPSHEMFMSDLALEQLSYLQERGFDLRSKIESRLQHFISPSSCNRIRHLQGDLYLLAYKTWRVLFRKKEANMFFLEISSGYDVDTLEGKKPSSWTDVALHQEFCRKFNFPCKSMAYYYNDV
jgi:tRNA-Thr(GGU) m(6)t(6)A37 methyltransferase TsaA